MNSSSRKIILQNQVQIQGNGLTQEIPTELQLAHNEIIGVRAKITQSGGYPSSSQFGHQTSPTDSGANLSSDGSLESRAIELF